MSKERINLLAIFLILVLATFLRFFEFGKVPPSLNWDEASLGYNAYSILKTGKDEWEKALPLTFQAFGDFKLPGYVYATVPFVAVFGLNEFSVRLPSIIAGILSVLLLYLIVKSVSRNKKVTLLSALFLSISPWAIFLSRIALEANLAFCLFLAGFYFSILGFQNSKNQVFALTLGAVFFGITLFTYNSARVFVPLFILLNALFFIKVIKRFRKQLIIPVITFSLFLVIMVFFAILKDSSSRYFWVTILDQGAINFLNEARVNSSLPGFITNLIYNRYSYFAFNFFLNYFKHFTPDFLFLNGGTNYQFSIPKTGLLYVVELPLLILGLINIFKHSKSFKVFLVWLMVAPIAASVTRESPHVLRSIFMLGSLQFIAAFGLVFLLDQLKSLNLIFKKIFIGLISVIYILSLVVYLNKYLYFYPTNYSQSWQYGYKEVYDYISMNNLVNSDQKIFISKKYGEPHIFYLLFSKYDPGKYQTNPTLIRYERSNWRWVDRLDNLYFINDWEVKEKVKGENGQILITSPGNFESGEVVKSIYFLDGSKAFDVVKI